MGFVCVYILKKKKNKQTKNKKQKTKNKKQKIKKKIQDFQIFPKKREKFWTRGIEPLSHLKKKSLN